MLPSTIPEEKAQETHPLSPSSPTKTTVSVEETHPPSESHPLQPLQDYDPSIGAKPYSPFYRHATASKLARLTSQRKRSRAASLAITSPIDETESNPPWQRLYDDEALNRHESKLWIKKKRYCDCLAGLSKGQRLTVKIAVAVLVVGSMIAIALGITAAVGGGIWRGENRSEPFES